MGIAIAIAIRSAAGSFPIARRTVPSSLPRAVVSISRPSSLSSSPSLSVPFSVSTPPLACAASRPRMRWFCKSTSLDMSSSSPSSIHDLTVKDIKGSDVSLSAYKDKVLLIVNVASQCGLTTSNYTELTDVYNKYKDAGLEILAFPCNQFGGQEPGTNEEIQQFACTRFKAEYPIFDKVDVNGPNTAPVYKYLKDSKGGIFGDAIKWNFTKFLVNREGKVVERYAPTTPPSKIEKDIKKLLGMS